MNRYVLQDLVTDLEGLEEDLAEARNRSDLIPIAVGLSDVRSRLEGALDCVIEFSEMRGEREV